MKKTRFVTEAAVIGALYVVLTFVSRLFGLDSGAIQVRISEALTAFVIFTPAAVPGLFLGCIISNLLMQGVILDVIFGSLATLIGAGLGRVLRKYKARLERAASIYTVEDAKANGIELHYVNTRMENATEYLRELTGGTGYDDVVCFAPVKPVIEQADDILGFDGCLNFFAGPTDSKFKAPFNWYNVHYLYTHVVGTSGGNTNDMQEAIAMMNAGKLNPSGLVTHIGGLNAVIDTTLNLPKIPGGKKLIYNHIDLPLTAISEFEEKGKTDPLFAELDRLCKENNGLWNPAAEKYLLANAKAI